MVMCCHFSLSKDPLLQYLKGHVICSKTSHLEKQWGGVIGLYKQSTLFKTLQSTIMLWSNIRHEEFDYILLVGISPLDLRKVRHIIIFVQQAFLVENGLQGWIQHFVWLVSTESNFSMRLKSEARSPELGRGGPAACCPGKFVQFGCSVMQSGTYLEIYLGLKQVWKCAFNPQN